MSPYHGLLSIDKEQNAINLLEYLWYASYVQPCGHTNMLLFLEEVLLSSKVRYFCMQALDIQIASN